jgi:ABC-type transport system involved in multi-copper enzyme maturation permease subunit
MSAIAPVNTDTPAVPSERWLDRIDEWIVRVGDSLNPILIKETRQALKSRQFVLTFSVLLFAALAWTILGSLSMMPQIYTSPSAPRMLIGYYAVLALPMLLVVPLAAYRSLEGEIDDGTLELLSITTLSPWQIVLGKLASAMLQMALYFVALVPCVAYAYTLRGVDLPTTLLILGTLVVAGILLTIVALFFAPLTKSRTGRISTLLATMSVLIAAEWGLAILMIGMILYGNPLSGEQLFFVVASVLVASISSGHLLLTATAAQLTPESENRSTHIRLALLILTAVILGIGAMGIRMSLEYPLALILPGSLTLVILWATCGGMMAAESPAMTPRIRRELPSSFAARCCLTWLTPGPATGLAFATVSILVVAGFLAFGFEYLSRLPYFWGPQVLVFRDLAIITAAYLIGMLVAVRWIIAVIRRTNNPRVELGIAALVVVGVVGALVPYAIGLHMNDYRPYSYTYWQVTNWAWTIQMVSQGNDMGVVISLIATVSIIAALLTLLASPELVMPRRIATPDRVIEELSDSFEYENRE